MKTTIQLTFDSPREAADALDLLAAGSLMGVKPTPVGEGASIPVGKSPANENDDVIDESDEDVAAAFNNSSAFSRAELNKMNVRDLRAFADFLEIDVAGLRKPDLVDAIVEAQNKKANDVSDEEDEEDVDLDDDLGDLDLDDDDEELDLDNDDDGDDSDDDLGDLDLDDDDDELDLDEEEDKPAPAKRRSTSSKQVSPTIGRQRRSAVRGKR